MRLSLRNILIVLIPIATLVNATLRRIGFLDGNALGQIEKYLELFDVSS